MQLEVRRAAIGDESVLRELRLQALTDSRRWLVPAATFILEADGEPRGLVAGVPDQNDSSIMHLMAMWVHPDIRGTGAADTLISSVKAWAVHKGASEVRLKVVEGNDRARRCYERAGFRPTGRQSVIERNGDIETEMAWACGASPNRPTDTSKTE
jgi:GNAT superfamily N-acetyltransferase